jgi:hypothetical protein
LIQVIARAYNLFEWGQYSQVNVVGATLQTEPVGIMSLTYNLDPTISDNNQVLLQWVQLTSFSDIGGSPILDYNVYQAVSPITTWVQIAQVTPDQSQYLVTGLTGGVTYLYQIRAQNVIGESAASLSYDLTYLAS